MSPACDSDVQDVVFTRYGRGGSAATDILIAARSSHAGTPEEFGAHPPAGSPAIDLGRGLSLEQLPRERADCYMDACVPRGWDPVPVRAFGPLYSFVRRDAAELEYPVLDPDETILAAVSLSRLVRANPVGYEWALRVQPRDDGSERLMPLDPGAGFLGYVDDRTRRNWLDHDEAERLRDLLAAYWRDQSALPERVTHALWLCEQTSRQQFLDLAWPRS